MTKVKEYIEAVKNHDHSDVEWLELWEEVSEWSRTEATIEEKEEFELCGAGDLLGMIAVSIRDELSENKSNDDSKKYLELNEEYWNERASEPLKFVRVSKEREDEYNRTHPLPDRNVIWAMIKRSQNS